MTNRSSGKFLRISLGAQDYTVLEAGTGAGAVAMAAAEAPGV